MKHKSLQKLPKIAKNLSYPFLSQQHRVDEAISAWSETNDWYITLNLSFSLKLFRILIFLKL